MLMFQFLMKITLRKLKILLITLCLNSMHLGVDIGRGGTISFHYNSKNLAPEYSQAAKDLKEEGIVLAKVDATVQKKLAQEYGVNGYPTLKFITQGKQMDFDGGRNADGIKQWIFSHINPGSEQLDTLDQVEDAVDRHQTLFFYFADGQPKDTKDRDFRRFKEFSFTVKGTAFAHTHTSGIKEHFKLSKTAKFVAFKNGKVYVYQRPLKIPDMKAFVEINQIERVLKLSDRFDLIDERIFQKEKPALLYFTSGSNDEDYAVINAREEHASEDYLLFVKISDKDIRAGELLEKLQIKESDAQGVYIVAKKGVAKFRLSSEITKDTVLTFISDWKDGKANRYLKSQDAPQANKGPVRVLVGSTYFSDVLKGSQDTVVLYYDSANEEQEGIQKQYESIAQRLQNNNILFAKIDCSLNEVNDMTESLEISKIRFYKGQSDSRQQVKFVLRANKLQEERLVKWVKDNARQIHFSGSVNDPKGEL